MRQNMLFSGLEAINYNINRRSTDLKLYEFGKVYSLENDKYVENQRLSIFITGLTNQENWNHKGTQVSFYHLKAIVDGIIGKLKIKDLQVEESTNQHFAYGLQYSRGNKVLVSLGAVANSSAKKADISQPVFYADFNIDTLLTIARKNVIVYEEISKFPAVRRDLSMLIDKPISFNQLKQIATKTDRKLLKEVNVFDVYEGDKIPQGKKSYALSFILQDSENTLTDKAIEAVMQKIIHNLVKEAGAEIRK